MPADSSPDLIPVSVLTGYLGAGKTTLLNRILTENHGKKYAVIINEFGEIGIDHDLIVGADEEIFEMNNGCLCCTIRGDLIRVIGNLLKRKGRFDAILVETTGLADPAPVAQTFFVDEEIRSQTRLDAIITLADARWLQDRLKDAPEAKNQIAFADIVLVNKVDLVSPEVLAEVEARIRGLNPYAKLYRTTKSAVDLDKILNVNAFNIDHILDLEPDFLPPEEEEQACSCCGSHDHHHEHHHHEHHHAGEEHCTDPSHHHHRGHDHHAPLKAIHDEEIRSIALDHHGDVDPEKFMPWINDLVQAEGASILRSKGILAFKDEKKRFVFQGVHMILDGDLQREWRADEPRYSRLVFIGRQLDEAKLRAGFEACVLP